MLPRVDLVATRMVDDEEGFKEAITEALNPQPAAAAPAAPARKREWKPKAPAAPVVGDPSSVSHVLPCLALDTSTGPLQAS